LGNFSFKKPTKLQNTLASSSTVYKFQKEADFEDDDYLLQLASIKDTLKTIKEMDK